MLSHQLTRACDAFVVVRPAAELAMAVVSPNASREQSRENGLDRAVAFACRVVAGNDVASVRSARVVGGHRLSGAELIRLHSAANEHGLRLTMDGSGMVTVRRVPRNRPASRVNAAARMKRTKANHAHEPFQFQ